MSILLIMAIIFMTLALVFYTIGVFAEKKCGSLLKWHALIFWLGFICDTSGTNIMGQISGHNFNFNLHVITGSIALLLMAFHAVWATVILIKKNDRAKKTFHKFSIIVWSIWLIPYIIGIYIGMNG